MNVPASILLTKPTCVADTTWQQGHVFETVALADTSQVAQMRRDALDTVRQRCSWLTSDLCDDLGLIIGELLANAVQHGAPDQEGSTARPRTVRLTVHLGVDGVMVCAYDGSPHLPAMRSPASGSERGRGLALVDGLTGGRWGHHVIEDSKYVWAVISRPASHGLTGVPGSAPADES